MTELGLSSLTLYFVNNYFKEATFKTCRWTAIKEQEPRCPIETQKGIDALLECWAQVLTWHLDKWRRRGTDAALEGKDSECFLL